MRLNSPSETDTPPETESHFFSQCERLFEHGLQNVSDSDMTAIAIHNEVNKNNKPIEIIFRRRIIYPKT
jgi:hypothetical protein